MRQDDAGKNLRRTRAEGRRRFFHRRRQRFQHRLHRAHDERDAGKNHGDDNARRFIGDGDAERRQRLPEPAVSGKKGGKGDARDGGRQGEGQIDQGVNEDAAGEAVAAQHPGEEQTEKRVKKRRPRRRPKRYAQGGKRLHVADDCPVVGERKLGKIEGKAGERQQEDDGDKEQAHAERETESGQNLQAARVGHGVVL